MRPLWSALIWATIAVAVLFVSPLLALIPAVVAILFVRSWIADKQDALFWAEVVALAGVAKEAQAEREAESQAEVEREHSGENRR